jgi:hypothetical protein
VSAKHKAGCDVERCPHCGGRPCYIVYFTPTGDDRRQMVEAGVTTTLEKAKAIAERAGL